MKRLMVVLALTAPFAAQADVEWAYQLLDESLLPQRDLDIDLEAPRTVPGSSLQRSQEQIDELARHVHMRCPVANMIELSGCELDIAWLVRGAREGATP